MLLSCLFQKENSKDRLGRADEHPNDLRPALATTLPSPQAILPKEVMPCPGLPHDSPKDLPFNRDALVVDAPSGKMACRKEGLQGKTQGIPLMSTSGSHQQT